MRGWTGPSGGMADSLEEARRWWGDDTNRIRALAQELGGLQPDIILTNGTPTTAVVQGETRTIPIVFANAGDPVGRCLT
jgi:ABC-type uncharacterized transport system substrate-binding protein